MLIVLIHANTYNGANRYHHATPAEDPKAPKPGYTSYDIFLNYTPPPRGSQASSPPITDCHDASASWHTEIGVASRYSLRSIQFFIYEEK